MKFSSSIVIVFGLFVTIVSALPTTVSELQRRGPITDARTVALARIRRGDRSSDEAIEVNFTKTTLDLQIAVVPGANVIIVSGAHTFSPGEGHVDKYTETIPLNGLNRKTYTVYIFHGGSFKMIGEGGFRNLGVKGNCEKTDSLPSFTCKA